MLTFLDKIPYATPRTRRLTFWLVVFFSLYTLIGFFIVPPVLKDVIAEQATEALNRRTSVQEVYFNPLTLHLEVTGVNIDKLDGNGQLVAIGSLMASPSFATLWKFAPVISYLSIRDFVVDITFFGDGRYSVSDLLGDSTEEEPEKNKKRSSQDAIIPFAIHGLELSNGTIIFDDRPHGKRHTIANLEMLIPLASSFLDMQQRYMQPRLSATVNGDPVELGGRTMPFHNTLLTEFELGVVDVDLRQYWDYVSIESPLQLEKGKLTSHISLFFRRPDAQRIEFFLGGGGQLRDVALTTPDDGTVVSFNNLEFQIERFSLRDNELQLNSVALHAPYVKVVRRKDGSINWSEYFLPPEESIVPPAQQEAEADGSLLFGVKHLAVNNGTVDWQDDSLPGGYEYTIPNIAFVGTDIATDGKTAGSFDLSMGQDKNILVKGHTTLEPMQGTAQATLTDIHLPDYMPYIKEAVALTAKSGILGASGQFDFSDDDGNVDVSIDNSTIAVSDIALTKPGTEEPSIGFEQLLVSGARVQLGDKSASIEEVRIDSPYLKAVRDKSGVIDLLSLVLEDENAVAKEEAVPKWDAVVKAVHLNNGTVSFNDLTLKNPAAFSLDTLKIDANNVTTKGNETVTYDIASRWGGRGNISIQGKLTTAPFTTDGEIRLRGFGLQPLDAHLGEFTELLFAGGTANTDLTYQFIAGDKPSFSITGNAALNRVKLKDNRGDGEFAGIETCVFNGIRLTNNPYRLGIANIHLEKPRAAINFDENGYLNMYRAFRIPPSPPTDTKKHPPEERDDQNSAQKQSEQAKPETVEQAPFFSAINIGKLTMAGGRVSFRDASVTPPYLTEISDMNLGLMDISQSHEARPRFTVSAKVGPTPITINGVANPLITPLYSDIVISIKGMELVPLSPYTIKYMAYPIEKGRLFADVTFRTENWELLADNKFFVEQLVLGSKDDRPDAPNVPVAFGLALLQDSNGDMTLNLPIRGQLNDPNFHIGGIVFKAIVGLFFKALASPFSLIGSIFGGGSESLDYVAFDPGRYRLNEDGRKTIDAIVKALQERTRLKLEIDGVVDIDIDRKGLLRATFENMIKQQKYDSLSRAERAETTVEEVVVAPEEYEEYLFAAYKAIPDPEGSRPTTLFVPDRQPVDIMEKFIIDRINITDEDLDGLAMSRATAVKERIVKQDASLADRVYLLDKRENEANKAGAPKHRADLGLK